MYNTNLKNQYISTLGKSEQLYALGSFNASEVLEVAFEKDVYDFTYDEIKQLFERLGVRSKSANSLVNRYKIFKSYIEFCITQELVCTNVLDQFLIDDLSKIIYESIHYITEVELKVLCKDIIEPSDQFILLAPYYGVTQQEILTLSMKQMNIKENLINLSNRSICIPKYVMEIAIESSNTFTRSSYFRQNFTVKLVGDTIIKKVATYNYTNDLTIKDITKRYNRVIQPATGNDNISYSYIRKSGIINKIKEITVEYNVSHTKKIENFYEIANTDEFNSKVLLTFNLISSNFNIKNIENTYGRAIDYASL